jgi:transposase
VRATKLDDYKEYLRGRVAQARPRWIPATVLLREIRERGYAGGISQLKAWLSGLNPYFPDEPLNWPAQNPFEP